ncbi:uncharacterized protein LOC126858598 [Cataglyphis hispanica]|uniref:uncharacterized protein LOC126858598 n=1 Tax=Cataglyphis hispanica TaxID=1086592 RepID=UPI00217F379C|nr:uncharacterized protein LOC126858598 [Cataglyphis hispanica]
MALPSLILDPELCTVFTTSEMNVINDVLCNIEFCCKCLQQDYAISIIYKEGIDDTNSKKTAYDTFSLDYAVYKALKILDKHVDILRTNPRYKHISMPSALFLNYIRYFLNYILCRMHLMSEQARNKELHYRQLWRCHKKSVADIAISTTNLERQRINHKRMLEDVVKQYGKNIIAINEIDKKCNEDIINTTIKYEKKQFTLYKAWEFEQNEIRLALENVIDDFESLKDINTKLQQTIRERKLTIESKLLAVIAKYDLEIGSRYQMLEELSEAYEYDKLEKHMLEKEIKRQEIYLASIKGKEKNEDDKFLLDDDEHLSTNAQQEHSARIISNVDLKNFVE